MPGWQPWRSALGLCVAAMILGPARSPNPSSAARAADVVAQATSESTPESRPAESKTGPAEAEKKPDKPKPQSPKEAEEALARLMAQRKPVRAATARGQTSADAPKFKVTPRLDRIRNYPCTKCHDNKFVDRRVRELQDEHTKLTFEHGGGRFWCYDACHKGTDIDNLVSLRGRPISYDESYKLCTQCHYQRLDWFFGGHGKRQGAWENQREIPRTAEEMKIEDRNQIGQWAGERVILNCTECHDAHSPAIKPFEPSPPPRVRSGLTRRPAQPEHAPTIWERLAGQKGRR